jgi:TRAP-type C4-dicarboxylate transport system substrate-binding protein
LPPQAQQWVQEAADTAAVYERELWKVATQNALEEVQKAGVVVMLSRQTDVPEQSQ